LRKEKNTIKVKKVKKVKKKNKNMKKILMFILLVGVTSCTTVKEKASTLKKIGDTCPPKNERTLKDIFCKEAK
tara:strand:- start:458 stop:676 length:219 start_codon:yes stop_codon:yes gene_type:complete